MWKATIFSFILPNDSVDCKSKIKKKILACPENVSGPTGVIFRSHKRRTLREKENWLWVFKKKKEEKKKKNKKRERERCTWDLPEINRLPISRILLRNKIFSHFCWGTNSFPHPYPFMPRVPPYRHQRGVFLLIMTTVTIICAKSVHHQLPVAYTCSNFFFFLFVCFYFGLVNNKNIDFFFSSPASSLGRITVSIKSKKKQSFVYLSWLTVPVRSKGEGTEPPE